MKNIFMSAILWFLFLGDLSAQDLKPVNNKQYMQITTVESVIAGGLGRSRMIITNADGTQKEFNLENLFSIAGINFRNIMDNETRILQTIREYTSNGWKIEQVTSLTLSPNDSGSGGIFMTRYLLSTADDKKAF
ncbi:MAG: hypothetical protein NTW29_19350 [Bacteroidetes bacterium]|nr:hypothetical protein [Bacteroidota bacterium]